MFDSICLSAWQQLWRSSTQRTESRSRSILKLMSCWRERKHVRASLKKKKKKIQDQTVNFKSCLCRALIDVDFVSLSQCCRRQSEIRRSCWWKTQSWRRTLSSWEVNCRKNREDARVDERRRKTWRLNAQKVFMGDMLSQNILGFCRMFLLCSFHFPEETRSFLHASRH